MTYKISKIKSAVSCSISLLHVLKQRVCTLDYHPEGGAKTHLKGLLHRLSTLVQLLIFHTANPVTQSKHVALCHLCM